MNRRLRILILVLLSAALFFSALIVSQRRAKEPEPGQESATPATGASLSLFVGTNGLWGVRSASGRILIEPTWYYLRIMSDTVLIARNSDGLQDRYGLILTTGEQLVPPLYSEINPVAPDVWRAALTENGKEHFHLYRADGTRFMDRNWDSCELLEDGSFSVTEGQIRQVFRLSADKNEEITRLGWHGDYPVGLHRMTVDFDEAALAELPPDDTLSHLAQAAADYLLCLFVTHEEPLATRMSADHGAGLHDIPRYKNCTLRQASVRRIARLPGDDYPVYRVELNLSYAEREDGRTDLADTVAVLDIGRNLAGSYVYRQYSDNRMNARYGVSAE